MDEQALRQLVRQAVARHIAPSPQPVASPSDQVAISSSRHLAVHPSHSLYQGLVNVTEACVIEPAVMCDHCGYCKSHGH